MGLARIARIPIQIEEFGQGEQLIAWIEEVASKNTVLTELMPALVRARRQKQALKVLEKAFADSRVVSRDEVFGAVEASVSILGALDRGQTLWRLYRALQEVEDWWVLPEI